MSDRATLEDVDHVACLSEHQQRVAREDLHGARVRDEARRTADPRGVQPVARVDPLTGLPEWAPVPCYAGVDTGPLRALPPVTPPASLRWMATADALSRASVAEVRAREALREATARLNTAARAHNEACEAREVVLPPRLALEGESGVP